MRHYTGLPQRQQAAEEWWGGAVALDHFMAGLPEAIADFTDGNHERQHLFRAWVVNTQTSARLGSHCVTIVIGMRAPNILPKVLLQSEPAADEQSLRAGLDDVLVRLQSSNHASDRPADAEATTQDRGNAPLLQCSGSAAEPDVATEHIAPASLGQACESSPGSHRS